MRCEVSVLFNEPKLLKSKCIIAERPSRMCFSALQRAEIAEIDGSEIEPLESWSFSALQRAEIAEIRIARRPRRLVDCFSALQRAEIAEMGGGFCALL